MGGVSHPQHTQTLPPSCADCLETWKLQPPGTPGPVQVSTAVSLHFNVVIFDTEHNGLIFGTGYSYLVL